MAKRDQSEMKFEIAGDRFVAASEFGVRMVERCGTTR